jgi:hypothetical protein
MDDQGPVSAGPRLSDAPIQFYLEHRRRIREWADLAAKAQEATSATLREMEQDLWLLAGELGSDVRVFRNKMRGGANYRLALKRESWPVVKGEAVAAVTIEWLRDVDPALASKLPVIGVRVDGASPIGARFATMVEEAPHASPLKGGQYRLYNYWPVKRSIQPREDWWKDVEGWRRGLVDGMRETWLLTIDMLDRAFADGESTAQ